MLHYNITFIKDTTTIIMIDSKHIRTICRLFGLLLIASTNLSAQNSLTNGDPGGEDNGSYNQGSIVVSIKPLYSLVAHLTQGIETPVLLMKQTQSPHHYSIRPSERRLLADAKMIIWLGPQMESNLTKIIPQSASIIVSAMQAKNLKLLKNRTKHAPHDEEPFDAIEPQHHVMEHHKTEPHDTEQHRIDPHIWLSTHNAAAISNHISEQLIAHDSSNTKKYQANLQQLLNKISQTAVFIKTTLKDARQPFIAYHDAFQYFENENALNFIAAISTDEESSISLKYMREIKMKIEKEKISCLVYQPPKPAIVNSLAQQHRTMKITMLDGLGITVENDENAWFELMHLLAENFKQCLSRK